MPSEVDIPKSGILAQLDRILASGAFVQSERMSRFLRLVVEYSLENRAAELKEYLIGVQVFDRKHSFDSRIDPIVRVEARRLRDKLRQFYESEGRQDEVRIELPKGSYAAQFSRHPSSAAPEAIALTSPPEAGIAVIPFTNLGPEGENEYFADGLTQELILGLTRVPGLRVVAWTSAAQLRGEHDFQTVGKRLKVTAVLTGSIRKAGRRVRITAQLIDTATNSYLWAEAYDRELRDLLEIQDEISRAIVATLRVRLADRFVFPAVRRAVYDFEAHNLYLRGRFECHRRTPAGLRNGARFFEAAIEREPGFALGWAGLADAYSLLATYGVTGIEDAMPKARHAALRAVELEPSLGEAWASLALVLGTYQWEREEATQCYKRAIALNPGYASVHHWYAVDHLAPLGDFDTAAAEIRLARMLDPWAAIIIEGEGFIHMLRGQYDEAIRLYEEALAMDPNFHRYWTSIGRVLIQKRQYNEAIEALEKGRSLGGASSSSLGALGQAHALAGNTQKAREILLELNAVDACVASTPTAIVHLGLGEKELALDALERACERREISVNALNVHPVYDPLRKHLRFEALLRRIRLA